ncbi:MAG: prephenate dehydrogenase [Clostridiales bacterium]|jgi:prephenate dehydrogenase|nr:prephenate dehydrogenase [Clostridiales bacterium]
MKIGIAGLGLIGGSLAKAYKRSFGYTVFGYDIDKSITQFAIIDGAIDGELNGKTIGECDCILIALYPKAACEYLDMIAHLIPKNALVMDCCGTKRMVCEKGFGLSDKYGFTFVGGHPMAGSHLFGYKNSRATLFDGAPMVITPKVFDNIALFDRVKKVLSPMNFLSINAVTAEKHDELIAFTSQLPHIVSNAYIKSPASLSHKGFSAGSFRDLTRVARLNPIMWTELFIENRDNLINELDILINSLSEYKEVLERKNPNGLCTLLEEGNTQKKKVSQNEKRKG